MKLGGPKIEKLFNHLFGNDIAKTEKDLLAGAVKDKSTVHIWGSLNPILVEKERWDKSAREIKDTAAENNAQQKNVLNSGGYHEHLIIRQ